MKSAVIAYFSASVLLLLSSFFTTGALDSTTHDTYWVIASSHVCLFGAVVFFIFGSITWALHYFKRRSSLWLIWIHLVITVLFPLFITLIPSHPTSRTFEDYSVYDETEHIPAFDWNIPIAIFGVLFVIAQMLFLINLVKAIVLKGKWVWTEPIIKT